MDTESRCMVPYNASVECNVRYEYSYAWSVIPKMKPYCSVSFIIPYT